MQEVIEFLKAKNVEKTKFFNQLKCSLEEAKILQYLSKEYINGRDVLSTIDILGQFYSIEKYEHLEKLSLIKSLLEYGWLIQVAFDQVKLNEASKLELINSSVALSSAYLKMLESGNSEFVLPEIKNYSDHLEYLQDQFLKIDITQQLNIVKRNFDINSPSSNRLKNKLLLVENRIKDRINATTNKILIEEFFKEQGLDEQEKILFLALLKEEYSGGDGTLREMNYLLELISNDDYEKIKYRSLLEESSTLISKNLVDYDEVLTPFGGINRNFYIPDEVLYKISHPNKKVSTVSKIKLETIIKDQEMFELISAQKSLEDVVLNPKTKETLNNLLKQDSSNSSNSSSSTNTAASSILKEVLNSIKDGTKSNSSLENILKNSTAFKDLGNLSSNLSSLLESIKDDESLQKFKPLLENFLKNIKDVTADNLKEQIKNSGIFLENKLSSNPNAKLENLLQNISNLLKTIDTPEAKNSSQIIDNILKNIPKDGSLKSSELVNNLKTLVSSLQNLSSSLNSNQTQTLNNLANELKNFIQNGSMIESKT